MLAQRWERARRTDLPKTMTFQSHRLTRLHHGIVKVRKWKSCWSRSPYAALHKQEYSSVEDRHRSTALLINQFERHVCEHDTDSTHQGETLRRRRFGHIAVKCLADFAPLRANGSCLQHVGQLAMIRTFRLKLLPFHPRPTKLPWFQSKVTAAMSSQVTNAKADEWSATRGLKQSSTSGTLFAHSFRNMELTYGSVQILVLAFNDFNDRFIRHRCFTATQTVHGDYGAQRTFNID